MTDATKASFGAVGNALVLTNPSASSMQLGCERPKNSARGCTDGSIGQRVLGTVALFTRVHRR